MREGAGAGGADARRLAAAGLRGHRATTIDAAVHGHQAARGPAAGRGDAGAGEEAPAVRVQEDPRDAET